MSVASRLMQWILHTLYFLFFSLYWLLIFFYMYFTVKAMNITHYLSSSFFSLVMKPTVGTLDFVSKVSEGVRNSTQEDRQKLRGKSLFFNEVILFLISHYSFFQMHCLFVMAFLIIIIIIIIIIYYLYYLYQLLSLSLSWLPICMLFPHFVAFSSTSPAAFHRWGNSVALFGRARLRTVPAQDAERRSLSEATLRVGNAHHRQNPPDWCHMYGDVCAYTAQRSFHQANMGSWQRGCFDGKLARGTEICLFCYLQF